MDPAEHGGHKPESNPEPGGDLAKRLIGAIGFAGLGTVAELTGTTIGPALLPALDLVRDWKNRDAFLRWSKTT
jgi:hypothetical protein